MKIIPFQKAHGTGNDFILVDNRKRIIENLKKDVILRLCDRHFGIGADGVLLLEDSPTVDFRMVYYNADGNEAMMCGNGARCICYFAHQIGMVGNELTFEANDGIHHAKIQGNGVRLQMVPPTDHRKNISNLDLPADYFLGGFINTGVEHLVIWTPDVEHAPVFDLGRKLRWSISIHPPGANVNFMEQINHHQVRVRTYERGVENETLSCGTGVTASALIASITRGMSPPISVLTKGGELIVDFDEHFEEVYLEGPVQNVFDGIFDIQVYEKEI
jgi:diaminopimelate epimerase